MTRDEALSAAVRCLAETPRPTQQDWQIRTISEVLVALESVGIIKFDDKPERDKFRIGDVVVRLKSGGPEMTIFALSKKNKSFFVKWKDDYEDCCGWFRPEMLTLVRRDQYRNQGLGTKPEDATSKCDQGHAIGSYHYLLKHIGAWREIVILPAKIASLMSEMHKDGFKIVKV